MSTYVISDIHGEYDKFVELLKKINFNDSDVLFLLGDLIDRGNDGIKLIQYCMYQSNIYPILGNHEYMAIQVLNWNVNTIDTEKDLEKLTTDNLQALSHWKNDGGDSTIDAFRKLSLEEREDILDYLNDFDNYIELNINDKQFILVHAGIDNFIENKELDDYYLHDLIFNKPDYNKIYYKDKYLITGHTPTSLIHQKDEIYKSNNHIAIDCGCTYGGKLAAICLETLEEYYV